MKHAKIIATGSYLPEKVLTNQDLEKLVETNDEWITERTGIKERHIVAPGETTSDLAYQAAIRALDTAGLSADQLDMIIVATSTPDSVFPSTACLLQRKLGIKVTKGSFDIEAACSGFIYALTTADCYIQSGMAKTILVVGVDVMSRIVDYTDRKTCILFGDGAGAVILGVSEEPGILGSVIHADGANGSVLTCEGHLYNGIIYGSPFIYMDGQAVFKFAVKSLAQAALELVKGTGVELSAIDWYLPHQANLRIIESTAKRLNIPMDKVVVTVDKHGNTSAASVPLALDIAVKDGRIQKGDILLLQGVGAGLTWGASLLKF